MQEVEGKVAFITGGSSGIGLGIARAFVDAGMKVVVGYQTEKHLEAAMKYLKGAVERVHAVRVNVTDRASLQAAADETVKVFGKVHVLVNNAGVHVQGTLSATSPEDWNWLMNVNVNGVLNGVQVFLPLIQSHGEGGQIVATASVLGLFVWSSNEAAYVASKFAVVGMMESLRMELVGTNIGVSVFCPGWVSSNLGTSNRNRQLDALAPANSAQDPAHERTLREMVEAGLILDPLYTGQLLLRGVCNDELYILSHPEWEPMMRHRHEALLAAMPQDQNPNAERQWRAREMTEKSIYVAQRMG